MEAPKVFESDALVIGAGAAGLRAAIAAHDAGAEVLVVGKTKFGGAHTNAATGGINAAFAITDPQDSWQQHAVDTLKEGVWINDPEAVEILCKNAIPRVRDIMRWGTPFHKEKGRYVQRFFGAHTLRRTFFVGDRTGRALMIALVKEVRKRHIKQLDRIYITRLLTKGKRLIGAIGVDLKSGKILIFRTKAIILATGGYDRLYKITSTREIEEAHGDGIALAYNAGVALQDMEMVQFHPTGMAWPYKHAGTLATEAMRAEGAYLYNSKHERFMPRYHPRAELGPRDVVARAIWSEIKAGRGTPHGGVWLDISHVPAKHIKSRLPKMYKQFRKLAGKDITKEPVEVAPTAHYSMGGLVFGPRTASTSVQGLFAAGEVTGGIHGANRLGGNSLADCLVFGTIAGNRAAKFSKRNEPVVPDTKQLAAALAEIRGPFAKAGKDPSKLKAVLRNLMQQNVGIVRNRKGLIAALRTITKLKEHSRNISAKGSLKGNLRWEDAMDLRNMLITAEAVVRSALTREESRGAHYREDRPERNDKKWLANIVCIKGGKGMRLSKKPVRKLASPWYRKVIEERKGAEIVREKGYVE